MAPIKMSPEEDRFLRLCRPSIGYDFLRDAIIDAADDFNEHDIAERCATGEAEVIAAQLKFWAKRGNLPALIFCEVVDQAMDNIMRASPQLVPEAIRPVVEWSLVAMSFLHDTRRLVDRHFAEMKALDVASSKA